MKEELNKIKHRLQMFILLRNCGRVEESDDTFNEAYQALVQLCAKLEAEKG